MELWLDTVDFDLIKKTNKQLYLSGITTNPSILSKSSLSALDTIDKLLSIQPGKVAVQVTESSGDEIIKQAQIISQIDTRIIVKIPVNNQGLFAIKALSELNIPTMATAVFETSQVLLSAMAGASYVAPYLGRISGDNIAILKDMLQVIAIYNYPIKLIAAAIRTKEQVVNVAKSGSSAITIPAHTFNEFIMDLQNTTESLKQFDLDWSQSGKKL